MNYIIGSIIFLTSISLIGCSDNSTEITIQSCHNDINSSINSIEYREYIVYIDNSFPEFRQSLIRNGSQQWEDKATNLHFSFESVSLERIHEVQYSSGTIVVINQDPENNLSGWTSWGRDHAYILIPNKYDDEYFHSTVIHEFGHALDLRDDPQHPNSIMWLGNHITCDDLNQFCSKWNCKNN